MTEGDSQARLPVRGRFAVVLLLLAAVVAVGLGQSYLIRTKRIMLTDDAISAIEASGHVLAFEEAANGPQRLSGRWVAARDWQSLLVPRDALTADQIADGLAALDTLPPLYFWLLAVWTGWVGVTVQSGPLLNMLLSMACVPLLYALAVRAFRDRPLAACVPLIYALSPQVPWVSFVARPYALLSLVSIAFVLQTLRVLEPKRVPTGFDWALTVVLAALGVLTHFLFGHVLVAVALVVVVRSWRRERARSMSWLGASGAGCLLAFAIFPGYARGLSRALTASGLYGAQPQAAGEMGRRADALISILGPHFGVSSAYPALVMAPLGLRGWAAQAAIALAMAVTALAIWGGRANLMARVRSVSADAWSTAFVGVWSAGAVIAMYLSRTIPLETMAARYFSIALPLLAFVSAIVARVLFERPGLALQVFMLLVLAPLTVTSLLYYGAQVSDGRVSTAAAVAGADRIVLDNPGRGYLPKYVLLMRPGTQVFAAPQKELRSRPGAWISRLAPGDLYISQVAFDATVEGRDEIVAALRSRYLVERLDWDTWQHGTPYRVVGPLP
jgi:hypothetical protein